MMITWPYASVHGHLKAVLTLPDITSLHHGYCMPYGNLLEHRTHGDPLIVRLCYSSHFVASDIYIGTMTIRERLTYIK